jgi:hypothetical protein
MRITIMPMDIVSHDASEPRHAEYGHGDGHERGRDGTHMPSLCRREVRRRHDLLDVVPRHSGL